MRSDNLYDLMAKTILTRKDVITNILRNVVTEYEGLSFDEVFHLIEDGSDEKKINGINTDDINISDGEIKYDILFTAKLPNSNDNIGLYVNIEAQGYNTTYPIIKRAIYYTARLISRQKKY